MDNTTQFALSNEYLSNLHDFYIDITMPANKTITIDGNVIASAVLPECTITIECEIENTKKIVKVKVSPDQYKLVINEEHRLIASKNNLANRPLVKITGILRSRSRGRHEIVEMSNFEVIVVS